MEEVQLKVIINVPDGDYCQYLNSYPNQCKYLNTLYKCGVFLEKCFTGFDSSKSMYLSKKCQMCLEMIKGK